MRNAVIAALALILFSGTVAGIFFISNQNLDEHDSNQKAIDTDSDGIYDENDTFRFDPECSEDQNDNGICDAREEDYNGASEEALRVSLETSANSYGVNDEFDVDMNIENPAQIPAENLDYTIVGTTNIGNIRTVSEASNRLPSEDSSTAVFETRFADPSSADENLVYQGMIEAKATAEYETKSIASVKLLTSEQLREKDISKESVITMNSGGPLILELQPRSPIIAQGTEETGPLRFEIFASISNLGRGEIAETSRKTPVKIDMRFPNLQESPKNACEKQIELQFDQSNFKCSFELERNTTGTLLTLKSEMNYDYRSTDQKTLTFE